MITKKWKNRSLIRNRMSQTKQVGVGISTSDLESSRSTSQATTATNDRSKTSTSPVVPFTLIESIISKHGGIVAKMKEWKQRSQISDRISYTGQVDVGISTSDFEFQMNQNSAMNVIEQREMGVQTSSCDLCDGGSQTGQVELGFQNSDVESQVNQNSATNVEVQAGMGARRHAWDVESQVIPNSSTNVREQADMGFRTAVCDFGTRSNLNSASYVEMMEEEPIKLSAETRRPTSMEYIRTLRNKFWHANRAQDYANGEDFEKE